MLPTARGPRCGQAGRTQRPRSLRSAPDTGEEQLAANVDMWWHLTAAELQCGVIDVTAGMRAARSTGSGRWTATATEFAAIPGAVRSGRLPG